MTMRPLFFACCSVLCVACGTTPPAGDVDADLRTDAGRDAATDGAVLGDAARMDADTSTSDTGNSSSDAGDVSNDDAGSDAGDAATMDARDASHDANDIVDDDTGATVVPDATVLGCAPSAHLSGNPLGAGYDWMGCGGSTARGSAANWTYNVLTVDGGMGFFHAPSIAAGSTGQAVVGTFLLPPPSGAAPLAIVCAGPASTVDVDDASYVSGFAFHGATTLHTAGSSAAGGLVITIGSSTTLAGDVGSHHFASATATTFGTYDATGANMTLLIGTTALSLALARDVDAIMIGIVQIASGSTTDVYTFSSGTATTTTITLPATVTLLGTCDAASTGAASLDGVLTH
jgi:hypothetical protein